MKNDYSLTRELTPESRERLTANMPVMINVDSSQIGAIGYDAVKKILFIRFTQTSSTYIYLDVPDTVFENFKGAESKGKFMNAEIRNKYQYAKL